LDTSDHALLKSNLWLKEREYEDGTIEHSLKVCGSPLLDKTVLPYTEIKEEIPISRYLSTMKKLSFKAHEVFPENYDVFPFASLSITRRTYSLCGLKYFVDVCQLSSVDFYAIGTLEIPLLMPILPPEIEQISVCHPARSKVMEFVKRYNPKLYQNCLKPKDFVPKKSKKSQKSQKSHFTVDPISKAKPPSVEEVLKSQQKDFIQRTKEEDERRYKSDK